MGVAMFRNRCSKFLRSMENTRTRHGTDGDALMAVKAGVSPVAAQFGAMLRKHCEAIGVSREQFVAMAREKFPDLNEVTPPRWWDGEKLPQTDYRAWFAERFSIEVPSKRDGKARMIRRPQPTGPNEFMEYAVGSLSTAIKSTDAQILHDVKDSLGDPVANPWMRIAVTLVRQAHLRR